MNNEIKPKKSWYTKWWGILIIIIVCVNIATLINSQKTLQEINNSNDVANIGAENNTKIDGFTKFTSEELGFSVLFPETPKENILDLAELTIYNFQAHKIINEKNSVQYDVFYTDMRNEKILEDNFVRTYLNNYISGKLSEWHGKSLKENDITFRGFSAKEYTFVSEFHKIEMMHKGLFFIIDGDKIELSIIYPQTLNEESTEYENFKKSFSLGAIDKPLSPKYWSNKTIKVKLPLSWEKSSISRENRILTYVNKAGHSIELDKMEFNNQTVSCADLKKEVGSQNIDNNGHMYRIFLNQDYGFHMKMILKCIENDKQSFVLAGKAPENTFFRSQLIFEKSLDSFDFE